MGSNQNDFVLDSNGRCFLCLDKIPIVKHERGKLSEPPSFPKYSLQYLSRYLKMDMRKVFKDTQQIPSHLLAKVGNSRLKVELCEECVRLTEQFSENYRNLEKAEMELGSCLRLIHAKFLNRSETDQTQEFKTLTNVEPHLQLSADGELQILEVLREEAFLKSRQMSRAGVPRVKFRKLTRKQIRVEKLKFQANFNIANKHNSTPVLASPSNIGVFAQSDSESNLQWTGNEIKLETQDILLFADGGNCSFDDHLNEHDEDMREDSEDMELAMERNEIRNNTRRGPELSVHPSLVEMLNRKPKTKIDAEKPAWNKNPETGKYRCETCSLEFVTKHTVERHYESVHLKVRFKCVTCGKEFTDRSACNRHQKTAHIGIRYLCQVCNKSFSQTFYVRQHQRVTECGEKLGKN